MAKDGGHRKKICSFYRNIFARLAIRSRIQAEEQNTSESSTTPLQSDGDDIPKAIPAVTKIWEEASNIAETKLSGTEKQWLKDARLGGAPTTPKQIAEEARQVMKDGRLIPQSVRNKIEKVLNVFDKYAVIINTGIQHNPETTALVWAGLRFILQIALNRFEVLNQLEEATTTITKNMADAQFYASLYVASLQMDQESRETTDAFRSAMESALPEFYAAVLLFSVKAKSYFLPSGSIIFPTPCKITNHLEPFSSSLEPYVKDINASRKKLKEWANMATMVRIKECHGDIQKTYELVQQLKNNPGNLRTIETEFQILNRTVGDAENVRHLAKLPRAKGAAFNSQHWEHMSPCLPDTRVALLEDILNWCNNSAGGPCIYWLSGMAGTGKSTIARTIATTCYEERRLGASFFFSRGHADLKNAGKFFTTIALQLGDSIPNLRPLLYEAMVKNPDISDQAKREQWKHLILNPLSNLHETTPQTFVVVIDALDECDGDDIQLIIRLLSQVNTLFIARLKVFITSRPETPIREGFRGMAEVSHRDIALQGVPREIIDHDISVYFREELKGVKVCSQDLAHLIEKAGGLFIWAATACRFIKGAPLMTRKRLSLILKDRNVEQNPEEELDKIYKSILLDSINVNNQKDECECVFSLFRRIVGTIVLLFNPLAMNDLAQLLSISTEDIEHIIGDLHSVLDIKEDIFTHPICQHHLSFRDFLLNEERCRDTRFHVNERKAHRALLLNCLNQMSKILRTDVCNFQRPGVSSSEVEQLDVVNDALPQHIQYACRYWVYHLEHSDIELHDDDDVHTFLRDHFLHWLEALSLMGLMSESIVAIQTLESILLGDMKNCDRLKELVNDAKRFTLSNRWTIERFPLQAYCSALIFTSTQNIVRKHFSSSIPKFVESYPVVHDTWDPLLQSLEGHADSVNTLAFSSDGKILASGSNDNTVQLWDPTTGDLLSTLEGHSNSVNSLAFSPDGKILASGSLDNTIRLWDLATGDSRGSLEGSSNWVNALAFSPDGKILASGSNDHTVRLWDPATGDSRGTLEGHSNLVNALAFSPDGKILTSGSRDKTVRLWDPATGDLLGTLEGHSTSVNILVFSPDGKILASGSNENTVRLWDPATGDSRGIFEGHSDWVNTLVFSPDGKILASGSDDNTVRLWDPATGDSCRTLEGHSNWINILAFSPDGKILASGSRDNTVRLWDPATGNSRGTLEGHSNWINTLIFSPDGKILASGSRDKTVQLWDPTTKDSCQTLEGHSNWINALAFSPDGKFLASGSRDRTIRLWDPPTGDLLGALKGHPKPVNTLAFSPDGKTLASGSRHMTVQLWDPATGDSRGTLEGHSDWINALAFSPDGKILASGSWDNTVRLWDLPTGDLLSILEGHPKPVNALAFSPDGKILASGSNDSTVRLWDPATGDLLGTLEGHSDLVNELAFSPHGKTLVSWSSDSTSRLWDITTQKAVPLPDNDDPVFIFEMNNEDSNYPTPNLWVISKKWICYGHQKVVFIPEEFRETKTAFYGSFVAWADAQFQIHRMQLNASKLPDILLE